MICFVILHLVMLLRKILFPFSILYDLVTGCRNFGYDKGLLKSYKFDVPTIVVGNLSVGGTGKTPQIEYLIRLLNPSIRLAVLSRGYKRSTKGFELGNETSSAKTIGDEPFQFLRKFKDVTIAVDGDRVNGINNLLKIPETPEVILLDDAFQHRRVHGGFYILLTSYDQLYSDDWLLPMGNLREARSGAKRAAVIVVTKCPEDLSVAEENEILKKINPSEEQSVFFSAIEYDSKIQGISELELGELKLYQVLLLTGIANPTPLCSFLNKNKIDYTHLKYGDHHNFTANDIHEIRSKYTSLKGERKLILTTEKDYVRILDALPDLHYLEIRTRIKKKEEQFNNLIKKYVEQSSANS